MKARIVKKLSKRAAPYLPLMGDTREQFPAVKDDNYAATPIDGSRFNHPKKGTIMVGEMSGYYQPEWEEQDAWSALRDQVFWHFVEFDPALDDVIPTRHFRNPGDVFRAAEDMIHNDLDEAAA